MFAVYVDVDILANKIVKQKRVLVTVAGGELLDIRRKWLLMDNLNVFPKVSCNDLHSLSVQHDVRLF